jgi:hypothetical protein
MPAFYVFFTDGFKFHHFGTRHFITLAHRRRFAVDPLQGEWTDPSNLNPMTFARGRGRQAYSNLRASMP